MPQDTEHKPERPLGLSPAQIAGSALSAVSAAFVASWAGTTGTLIGAAVGSVVATIGAALYTASLRRSSEAVRRAAAQVRQTSLLTGSMSRTGVDGGLRAGDGREGPEEPPIVASAEATNGGSLAEDSDTQEDEDPGSWRNRLPWGKTLVASLAVLVVALGGITAVEAITGHPISSWLGRGDSTGTTVGNVGGSDRSSTKDTGTDDKGTDNSNDTDQTTPSQDAQPSSPADPKPSSQPSQAPSQAPSVSANPDPSAAP